MDVLRVVHLDDGHKILFRRGEHGYDLRGD